LNLKGYIKLHRKMMSWKWKDHPPTFCLFVHLLLTASFTESSDQGIHLEPGQVVISRNRLAKETGLTEDQTRRALNNLQNTGEIILSTSRGCKTTIATIQNWPKYQVELGDTPSGDDAEAVENQGSQGTNNLGPPQVKHKKTTAPSSNPSSDPSTAPSTAPSEQGLEALQVNAFEELETDTAPSTAPSTNPSTNPSTAPALYKEYKKKERKNKNTHGEFVRLTTDEYDKLLAKYGEAFLAKCIERLNSYIGSKGKDPYKSHYYVINSGWLPDQIRERNPGLMKPQQQATTTNQPEYDPLAEWGGTL